MSRALKGAFVLGIFVLAVALMAPTLIDATQENDSKTLAVAENETRELTDTLSLTAESVNVTGENATILFEDQRTLDTNSTFVNTTENGNVTLSGDRINVSMDRVTDDDDAIISVSYSPMFGWSDGARLFMENAGLLIALLAGAMVIGVIWVIK